MTRTTREVLIVGAGIAGPTLAYWLLRNGFTPTLVERAPALRTGGYMIDFWGVGYDVAERMGLRPALHRDGYRIEEVRLVDGSGRRVAGFDASVFRSATGDRFVSLPRGELARHVYGLVEGRIETIFGDTVTGLAPDEGGVTVTFERAASRRFDLVVGADGLHSRVRALALGDRPGGEHPLGYHTAAFSVHGYPHRDEGVYVSHTVPGRQVARYALRDGRSAFFFVFRSDCAPAVDLHDLATHPQVLREVYGGRGWECDTILAALDRAGDLYLDVVSQVRMSDWWQGRVVLLGDAAYCPSLLAGQGSALAIAGAYLLARALASHDDHVLAFRDYQRVFQRFVEGKQRGALWLGGWFAPRTRVGLVLRNLLTNALRLPWVGEWMIASSVGDRFELPAAGDSAPP